MHSARRDNSFIVEILAGIPVTHSGQISGAAKSPEKINIYHLTNNKMTKFILIFSESKWWRVALLTKVYGGGCCRETVTKFYSPNSV